jgi:hypothetical protein
MNVNRLMDKFTNKSNKIVVVLELLSGNYDQSARLRIKMIISTGISKCVYLNIEVPLTDMDLRKAKNILMNQYEGMYMGHEEIDVSEKRQEVLDWMESLKLMYKLTGDV